MVKRVPKSTTSDKKAASTVKKTVTKEKKLQKLTNGSVKEKPEMKSNEVKNKTIKSKGTTESDKEIEHNTENERLSDMESAENENITLEAQSNKDTEIKELHLKDSTPTEAEASTSNKNPPTSLKRKADLNAEEVNPTKKGRTKKQKVVFEIPEISSIVGKVFAVGDNSVGQLGFDIDDIMEKKRPAILEMPYSIVDITAGGMHSVCLTQTGEVITFGCNDEGALGRETEDGTEYIPKKVDIPEKIVQVSAGDSHTAALSESGQVYIWGNFRNNNGAMGLIQPNMKQTLPVMILNGVTVVKIASGSDHLSCLSNEGIVYTCGNGETGQLGRISEHLSADGGRQGINLLLNPRTVPVRLSSARACISDVWTCSLATFLKSNNGTVYAFGLNNYGQLGVNPDERAIWKPRKIATFNDRSWTQINGGQHHTLALDDEGLVYALGRSEYGRLGLGEDCDGIISEPTTIPYLQDKKCVDVSCGNVESFTLEDNGSVYSWGMGSNHALGHGNDKDQLIPKLIEGNFYNSWKALKVSGGGNHSLILAHPRNATEETQ